VHIASFQEFLALFTVLPLSDAIMRRSARTRALLRKQGKLIPDLDLLIAARAVEHRLLLLTRNHVHFQRIPDLMLCD
jgi:predicted nucleic acid-binding protein